MARLSKVVLSHITIPGNHTITFETNAARDSWFDGRTKTEYTNLTYVKQEGIQLDVNLDTARQYNFGYYKNEIGDRIYFRVVDNRYVNENTTLMTIEKDVLMTFLPTSTMYPSFIERSNDTPSSLFDSDVPELQYNGGFTYTQLDFFGTLQAHSFFLQLSGAPAPSDQYECLTHFNPKNFDNDITSTITFGSMFRIFDGNDMDFDHVTNVLDSYMHNGTADRIVSAGTVPTDDIAYDEYIDTTDKKMVALVHGVRQTKTVNVSSSINTRIAKDNSTIVIAEMDNFANKIEIPISELSSESIQLVSVSDPISQQRHYGILSGIDGSNELKYRITINTGTSLPSMNLPYYMAVRNIETDLGAQQANNLIGGISGGISGAVAGGAGGAALGGGAGAVVGAVGGLLNAALTTATTALQNEVSAKAALEKAGRMTPSVSGTPSGFGVFANRAIGVNIFIKEPSGTGLQQFVDYYRFFGYNKNRIVTPTVKTGTHFYSGNVNGNYPGASANDAATIRALFSSGVWLWDSESAFFGY